MHYANIKSKHLVIFVLYFLAMLVGTLLLTPQTAYAAPAKCIVFDAGSQPASDNDDTYTLVDCEASDYRDLRDFGADKYYKIGVTKLPPPVGDTVTVNELTQEQYDEQLQLIDKFNSAQGGSFEGDCESGTLNKDSCGIVNYIVTFTRVLSGIVGVVIVIMIAVGGIQFSMARDNPQAVAAARGRIVNALIALVFYLFSFAILQWLVPGGIL